jgi:hypothetical protein
MATNTPTVGARKFLTRILAAGALLAIYCVSTIVTTGAIMTTGVTSAEARGRGRGWRGGRGFRGRGRHWVCRHNHWNSGRRCFWAW